MDGRTPDGKQRQKWQQLGHSKIGNRFCESPGRIASGAKLIVKLISNQPLASEVAYAIAIIRAGDQSDPNAERFSVASGLSGQQLLAFLDALDVSDMGSGSRSALQDAIANELSQMSADKADTLVLQMQSHIRMLMLPEASQDIITSSTVLSWFGISTLSALFPAPADLQPMVDAIQRAPAKEVRDAFLAGNQLVCFYGLGVRQDHNDATSTVDSTRGVGQHPIRLLRSWPLQPFKR